MKYLLAVVFIALMLLAVNVEAARLVAPCVTGADYYIITGLPSTYDVSHVLPDPTGEYAFQVVITDIPAGRYSVAYKVCTNLWGCSPDSEAGTFEKPVLAQPGGACRIIP